MKIVFIQAQTMDGFTYEPGEHEVDERTGNKLLHNYPNFCFEPAPDADAITVAGTVPEQADEAIVVEMENMPADAVTYAGPVGEPTKPQRKPRGKKKVST